MVVKDRKNRPPLEFSVINKLANWAFNAQVEHMKK